MEKARRCRSLAWWVGCALLAVSAAPALSIKTTIPAGQTECISETISVDHFQVPGGARLDGRVLVTGSNQYYVPFIIVRVKAPNGDQIWQQMHVYSEAHFNVGARGPGTYQICFTNPLESRSNAVVDLVYFTLAHLRSGGGSVLIPKGTLAARSTEVAHSDHTDDVRRSIRSMAEFMEVISGSQRYMQRKLDRHKLTMESNKRRTLWYSLLEVLVLLTVMGVQVYTITHLFKGAQRLITSV